MNKDESDKCLNKAFEYYKKGDFENVFIFEIFLNKYEFAMKF